MLLFLIVLLCLSSSIEAAKLQSRVPDRHHDSPVPKPASKPLDYSLAGDPPAFTEVLRIAKPDIVSCSHRLDRLAFAVGVVPFIASRNFERHRTFDYDLGAVVPQTYTWLDARNECRKRCMELVGLEDKAKFKVVSEYLERKGIEAIWTSGHLCDFKGCEKKPELRPLFKNGWFWTSSKKLFSDHNYLGWSDKGHFNQSQPDQAELKLAGTRESCVTLMNNAYKDGVKLHDVACYHEKEFMCEDSPALVDLVEKRYGVTMKKFRRPRDI